VGDGAFEWVLIGFAVLVLLGIVAYVSSWPSRR
jgi:hypothetical protein